MAVSCINRGNMSHKQTLSLYVVLGAHCHDLDSKVVIGTDYIGNQNPLLS